MYGDWQHRAGPCADGPERRVAVAGNFTGDHVARFSGHEELWERPREGISARVKMKERSAILHL